MLDRRQFLAATTLCALAAPARAQVLARRSLGDGELLSLSDGGFDLPLRMLSRDRPMADLQALSGATDSYRTALNVACLRRGGQTILFDCGSGANFLPGSGKLAASLEAAGIAPDSVTHVLFTHLHPDHLWGALDDFDSPAFPNATWRASAAEVAFWTDPGVFSRLSEDRHAFAAGAQRVLKGLKDVLETFVPGAELAPGVMAISTPGHTPGHVCFEVRAGGEATLILGDALTHPIISFAHPRWSPISDHDAEAAVATRLRLLDKAASERLAVIGYHLPGGGLGRVERDGAAWRFVAG